MFSPNSRSPVTGLPTGNIALDWQSGVGGLPIGRITELYGFEASGKTTTALQTSVQLQHDIIERASDQRIVYLDFEHALDVDYAGSLGLDVDHPSFVPLQPSKLEQGASAALDLIDTGKVPLIVFDSVAAMAPQRFKDGSFDQATIQMHRAKLISALCLAMLDSLHATNCAAVFINHKQESIDLVGRPGLPPKVTTPGGRGLKFYASLRLEFDVIGGVKNKMEDFLTGEDVNQLVGTRVNVKCIKNKVGTPGQTVELRNRYGRGFDNAFSALQILQACNEVKKNGSWYDFRSPEILAEYHQPGTPGTASKFQLHGEPAVFDHADADPRFRELLITAARRCLERNP
jgi:recombination protein RecA